jgi:transmembrane sensor
MSTNEQRVRGLISAQAADWFVENRDGLDAEQRREFTAWLKASPTHVEEYLALTALAQDLPAACAAADETPAQLVARAQREDDTTVHSLWPNSQATGRTEHPRRWPNFALAASLSVLSVGLLTLAYLRPSSHLSNSNAAAAQHLQTRHGEQQTYRLTDHSVIHLNTDTQVTVRIDDNERLVVLEAGEADFEVAHEARRPFRVSAGSAQVVDIGTRFEVRLEQAATLVTVTAGLVKVGLTSNPEQMTPYLALVAGQQIRVADGDWPARPVAVNVERTTAWLHRQIKFDNETLARVTSEFNRYAPTPFEVTTPALQDLRISGVLATGDTEAFIAFLRSLKDVHVEVTATRIRVSQY